MPKPTDPELAIYPFRVEGSDEWSCEVVIRETGVTLFLSDSRPQRKQALARARAQIAEHRKAKEAAMAEKFRRHRCKAAFAAHHLLVILWALAVLTALACHFGMRRDRRSTTPATPAPEVTPRVVIFRTTPPTLR